MDNELYTLEVYMARGFAYNKYIRQYEIWKRNNPNETISKEEWLISVLLTDLLVAEGKIDKIYYSDNILGVEED